MLVLSRKEGEAVIVGEEIIVTVIEIRGDKVRLGFQAASDIPIHRKEIHDQIEKDRRNKKNSQ